jgi:hypothetical protein
LTRRYNATSCCLFAHKLLLAGLETAGLPLFLYKISIILIAQLAS